MRRPSSEDTANSSLVLAGGIAFLLHLVLLWRDGSIVITEPRKPILVIETLVAVGIIGYGLKGLAKTV